MSQNFLFSFPRYLSSKKTVDDRALNRVVIETFRDELTIQGLEYPRILEIGAGIGSMIDRLVDWTILKKAHYFALDSMEDNIAEARRRITGWAADKGFQTHVNPDSSITVRSSEGVDLTVNFILDDVFRFIESTGSNPQFDILVSNAFLDLIDMKRSLSSIISLLKPNGLYYFSINFDGSTVFQPEVDPELDERIEHLYHQTMDERITNGLKSGDSKAGRHLFKHLIANGCSVMEVGASDWVVAPLESGYRHDEQYFIRFIVETVGSALQNNPGVEKAKLDLWLEIRRNQITNNELFYMAHQLDYVGRRLSGNL